MSVEILGLVGFALMFVLLGVLAFVVFRRLQAARQREDEVMTALGFSEAGDDEARQRIAAHFAVARIDRPHVSRLRRRTTVDGPTFWVCAIEWGGSESWSRAVLVESERLTLPRFLLLPRVRRRGQDQPAMDLHLHSLMRLDHSSRAVPPVPVPGTGHTLSGPDPTAALVLFEEPFRQWLRETEGLALSGSGQLLAVWPGWSSGVGWAPALERDVGTCLERAERCLSLLSASG